MDRHSTVNSTYLRTYLPILLTYGTLPSVPEIRADGTASAVHLGCSSDGCITDERTVPRRCTSYPPTRQLGRGRGVGVEEGWMRCRLHECSWPGTGWPMDGGCVDRVARVILVSVGVLVASVRACVLLYVYHCVRVCGETIDGKCLWVCSACSV